MKLHGMNTVGLRVKQWSEILVDGDNNYNGQQLQLPLLRYLCQEAISERTGQNGQKGIFICI